MTSRAPTFHVWILPAILIALSAGGCRTWSSREETAAQAYNLGNILRESGRLAEAEASYREALEHDPDIAVISYNLALTLVELGKYDQAITYLERLRSSDPENLVVIRALAWTSWRAGDSEGALVYYNRALAIFPADIESLKGCSEVLEHLGRYSESITKRALLVELEGTTGSRQKLAETLFAAGSYQQSLETWQAILLAENRNQTALDGAYNASMELGRYHDALEYQQRSLAAGGKSGEIWWNIARLNLLNVGNYQNGIEALKKALEEGFADQKAIESIITEAPPAIRPAIRSLLTAR
jgi:tetratricopeptide (TPR) repeat protein